jgi:hypothetical protein
VHKGTDPEITQLEASFLSDPNFDPNKKFERDETLLQKEALTKLGLRFPYIAPEHFLAISHNNGSTNAQKFAHKQICEYIFSHARQREMSSIIEKNKRSKIPSKYVSWLKVLAGVMTVKQYWESCNAMEHANGAIDGPLYQWDDDSLEKCHCFVQLVFPTFDSSQFVGEAPYIDPTFLKLLASVKDSCSREEYDALIHQIQNVLIINFERIARFWGIGWRNGAFAVVNHAKFTNATKVNTHNKQRMTRVLIAICALGMKKTAKQFYRCLSEVDNASLRYFTAALETKPLAEFLN